jgi:hypothetical protein
MTESPVPVGGNSIDSLRWSLQQMIDCLSKDTLIEGEIVFVDPDAAVVCHKCGRTDGTHTNDCPSLK